MNRMVNSGSKDTIRSRLFRNISWILVEKMVLMMIALVIGVMMARYLGPYNFGVINYSLSIMALFFAVCQLGLSDILMKDLLQDPEREGERVGSAIMMCTLSGAVSIGLNLIIVLLLEPGNYTLLLVSMFMSFSMLFRSFELIDIWFQIKLQSKYVSFAKMMTSLSLAAWKIILIVTEASVYWFSLLVTIEALLLALILYYMYKRQGGTKWRFSLSISRSMLSQSYHLILSGLMVTIYMKTGHIMIGSMLGEKDVGIYAAAVRLAEVWFILPLAIIHSAKPIIVEQKKQSLHMYHTRLRQLFAVIIWLSIIVGVLFSIGSTFLVQLLYGSAYSEAAAVLSINIWAGLFAMIGSARTVWIICEGYQHLLKYYMIFGAITNLSLNWMLIPLIGIYGASWATLAAQFVVAVAAPLLFKRTRISAVLMLQALLLRGLSASRSKVETTDKASVVEASE